MISFCKKFSFVFLCVTMSTVVSAQSKRLVVNSDYAIFHLPKNEINSYIELYFSYPDNAYTLTYNKQDSIYQGSIQFEIIIKNQTNDSTIHDKWEAPFNQKAIEQYTPQDFYGLKRYYLKEGDYLLTLLTTDVNGKRQAENRHEFQIQTVKGELSLSSLQVTNKLTPAGNALTAGNSPELFLKNQHYVYPNPQREVSAEIPTLNLYSEIYNAKKNIADSITLIYNILNAKNEIVLEHTRRKHAAADAIVETISFPLDAVPTGVYSVSLTAKNGNDSATTSNNFYLINQNVDAAERTYYTEDELFDISEFATYEEDKINLEFAQSKVLATKSEINVWDKLSELKAKQRFMFRFWYTRNSDTSNSFNKDLADFRDRVRYVNTYYSYAGHYDNGWQTDRGEIYIKFGEPDYKDEVPGNAIEKPYQIWTYHAIEGGAQFVFVDNMGLGNFRLVHSTHSAYVHNYNWQRLINSLPDSDQ